MLTAFSSIHWLPVIVAAVAYFMLGALWFGPFTFGGFYDKGLGFMRPPKWTPSAEYYVGPFLGCFLAAVATAVLLRLTNCASLQDALGLGLVVGVGYAGAVSGVNAINPVTPRPFLYGAVTGFYHIVGIILVAAIEFLWR